jgi:hypothetical protein
VTVELPAMRLAEEDSVFGWVNGRAVALLKKEGVNKVQIGRASCRERV